MSPPVSSEPSSQLPEEGFHVALMIFFDLEGVFLIDPEGEAPADSNGRTGLQHLKANSKAYRALQIAKVKYFVVKVAGVKKDKTIEFFKKLVVEFHIEEAERNAPGGFG